MSASPAASFAANPLPTVWDDVRSVCQRIPPLWDLANYVAVNPFLGFVGEPVDAAARTIQDGLGGQILPSLKYFQERWASGAFTPRDLASAAVRLGRDPRALAAILNGTQALPTRTSRPALTFAERIDRQFGTQWQEAICRSVARWCAVHVSQGGTHWQREPSASLYRSWLEAAHVDRTLEIAGLRGWRNWVAQLHWHPETAIHAMLTRLHVPRTERKRYLYRVLGSLYGWASYLRRASWERGSEHPEEVADLLAMLVCSDAAVAELTSSTRPSAATSWELEDESFRLAMQEALEDAYARSLLKRIVAVPAQSIKGQPRMQAIFCIDVRSERLRRRLEAQSQAIETYGFAGFFGIALAWGGEDGARCPVLLKPNLRLKTRPRRAPSGRKLLKGIPVAPAAAFTFVELLGTMFGLRLAAESLGAIPNADVDGREPFSVAGLEGEEVDLHQRVELAASILKNMGLASPFARVVLMCGHESSSANNPHAASLDCGACGGHGGAINARAAANLLNDQQVRAGLRRRGWRISEETHFLPAVHNTTVDEVELLDLGLVPAACQADVAILRQWLEQACQEVRQERAADVGLAGREAGRLRRLLGRRGRDWSEVRPEWGLAGNAAFLAARRARTRRVDLQGRVFLHEYDAARDADGSVLALVLSAPMVVASWINLQYFASTVDNGVFGCGTKTLHNRVGSAGVVLGNGGDLRTGLAEQSVFGADGQPFHEPLRLQVMIEDSTERIDRALAGLPEVAPLIENGWVRLFALARDASTASRWTPGHGWQPAFDGS